MKGLVRPKYSNLIGSATLRMNEEARRIERTGRTVYKFGFGGESVPSAEMHARGTGKESQYE